MNKGILIIANWYQGDFNRFQKTLKELNLYFENIIIFNKSKDALDTNFSIIDGNEKTALAKINSYLDSKSDIQTLVFIDNIVDVVCDDIIKCCEESNKNPQKIILGTNENVSINEVLVNTLFNNLFNTNFKSVLPELKVINANLFNELEKSIQENSSNYLITALSQNIKIKETNIKTVWRKNEKRVGESSKRVIPYLKSLIPFVLKAVIPYLISLILFIIIFYLRNDINDLKGIIIANTISEVVGIVLHIIMNYQMIYKNNLIKNNLKLILRKIFRLVLASFFIYVLYNLLNINLLISKILIDIILASILTIIFRKIN